MKATSLDILNFKLQRNSAAKFAITAAVNDSHEEAAKTADDLGSNTRDIENLLDKELMRHERCSFQLL